MKYNAAGSPVLEFGQIGLRDDELLTFGDDEDFRFYHDGTDSFLKNDTGDLIILGNRDTNDPVGGVYILDDYALANEDGGYTHLAVGLRRDQIVALTGGVPSYGGIHISGIFEMFGLNFANGFFVTRINGTFDAPTAILSGQALGGFVGQGWDGSVTDGGFEIRGVAIENWSGSARGTRIELRTIAAGGTTLTERARVFTNGMLVVDGAVGTPAWSFLNDTDCGAYRIGTNNIGIGVAGAKVLDISATGLGITGGITDTAAHLHTGVISPTQLAANTNDWAPTNFATTYVVRATTDAARDLTGIAGGAAGRQILLANVGGFDLVLKHDVTSTAANRFYLPNSADLTLSPNDAVTLWYDTTSSRWRTVGAAV